MTQGFKLELRTALIAAAMAAGGPALAAPDEAAPGAPAGTAPKAQTVPAPAPVPEPVLQWRRADAQALLEVIRTIDSRGLFARDYLPDALQAAIAGGEGDALDAAAGKSFTWLAEDLRDGRTPVTARAQWFAVDPDRDAMPTGQLMARALETHDVAGVLTGLDPTHPDYRALKAALAATPQADTRTRSLIRANMDRWRWLAHDLGEVYLLTNVPEFQLRLTVNNKIIRTYRTVVGKPGKTATPQLAEKVTAVVFNPTWTVPQSIVVGEGLGKRLIGNAREATSGGYKATRNADGTITVVQQPGPSNALGLMKIDMPNPHAIYLHDTPSKQYFQQPVRAYSHGCIRTERAVELGMTMAILGAGMPQEQLVANYNSGKYTKVPMTRTFPVYITYFTMAQDITGKLATFRDLYGRDAPVLASFAKPREAKTAQRISSEPVVKLDNPL
ncbi:MAG: L,D-transpeptidase family protein [Novosphingobium sp.]|jgi:murein L,D-transpeptidase YcbB/YkuD|nr:L,D-transpeptidase family protein [Novosphingobium sp.]